jgi:hypothetical protein
VSKNQRTIAAKVTAELNIHIVDPVSTKTLRRQFHKSHIHGRAAVAKHVIIENNAKRRKRRCDDHKTWTSDIWENVIWSPTSGRDYVWRTPKEGYNPECLAPTVKHGRGSEMIWAAISWYSAGPIITLNGRITTSDYVDILGNRVNPTVQCCLLTMMQFFKMAIRPHSRSVQSWFEEHGDVFQHLP